MQSNYSRWCIIQLQTVTKFRESSLSFWQACKYIACKNGYTLTRTIWIGPLTCKGLSQICVNNSNADMHRSPCRNAIRHVADEKREAVVRAQVLILITPQVWQQRLRWRSTRETGYEGRICRMSAECIPQRNRYHRHWSHVCATTSRGWSWRTWRVVRLDNAAAVSANFHLFRHPV
jgi:hypothetical protein